MGILNKSIQLHGGVLALASMCRLVLAILNFYGSVLSGIQK